MGLKATATGLASWCMVSLLSVASLCAASADLGSNVRMVDAAKRQDKEAVRSLIKNHADVNVADADGTTALAWAAHWDDLEMTDLLIGAGANANAANDYGVTPLSLACTNRDGAMVEKLLQAKANPNLTQWTGETPLMTAASVGSVDAVKSLLAHGAKVNAQESDYGQTALMWAISFHQPEIAKLLIENGADIHAKTHAQPGIKPMVLASYGTDVQANSKGGYTPMIFAARAGDLETIKLLLAKGADVNESTPDEGNTLVIATAGGYEKMALFLLDKGANPNSKDGSGITALHYAMRDGLKVLHGLDISNVKRICGAGAGARGTAGSADIAVSGAAAVAADGDTQSGKYSRKGDTLLPGHNMTELAKALLAHGADPNAQLQQPPPRLRMRHKPTLSLSGATPFFLAAASGDLSSMKLLVEGRAKPLIGTVANEPEITKKGFGDDNQVQGNGTTLMVAVGLGRHDDLGPDEEKKALEAAKVLVELGADVNAATDTGWTALHAAAFGGANSLVQFLVDKGANINAVNGCGQTAVTLAEGTSARGLLERVTPHKSTGELLHKLGAATTSTGSPVGRCVEGRFGLEYAVVKPGHENEPLPKGEE